MRVEGASERPNAGVQKEGGRGRRNAGSEPGLSDGIKRGVVSRGGDDLGLIVRGLLASR
jgi:hypothetical protein